MKPCIMHPVRTRLEIGRRRKRTELSRLLQALGSPERDSAL